MSSPVRSVTVRLAMDPSSYVTGASKAEASTLSLDRAVSKVGGTTATSMEKAAAGAGKAEGAFGKLNKSAGALGFTLGGLAGVGAAVGAAMSVKWAGDYESALTRLVTTAGESQKNIKMVGQGFLDMAGQVGISADEIAKAAYTAESAGFHGADVLTVMKAASEGARQENADLGKVVDATTTILHDYHLKASDAARVTSQLITAVSHGKVSFDELTGALDAITPLASRAGISIADVTGTLAAMTASGMSADQATQNMQNTLLHLAAPTNTMIAELAQLGVSTDDLANSLSQRGLAGTLQMVEEAIVAHLDPATQRVLLPAMNQSKTAVQDLHVMLGQMPPDLAKLSRGLMDGSVTFKEYRKAVQDLGGPSSAMGKQFLSLYESSQGFNNVLKAGGPAAQTFTAAMSKAFGTTAALNVALQTTGENADATNAAIADIAKAVPQADGSIKGWAEVQHTFNQQLHEAEAGMKSLAIEAGQHLLPVLSSGLGWVAHTGVPAIEGLAHGFSELPGPVKEAAAALAALKLAEMLGVTGGLTNMVGRAAGGFRTLGTAYGEAAAQARFLAMVQGESSASIAVAGARAGTAAAAMQGLKSAGSGVVNMLGGPMGTALVGGVAALGIYQDAEQRVTEHTQQLTQALQRGGDAAVKATSQINAAVAQADGWQNNIGGKLLNSGGTLGFLESLTTGVNSARDYWQTHIKSALDAKKANDDYKKSLDAVQLAELDVQQKTHALNDAYGAQVPDLELVHERSQALAAAKAHLADLEQLSAKYTENETQAMQDQASAALASANSTLANQQQQLELSNAITALSQGMKDGTLKGNDYTLALNGVAQQAITAAAAAGQAAADQAKANGVTDTATAANKAQLDVLMKVADQLGVQTPDAIRQAIAALQKSTDTTNVTTAAMKDLGLTVNTLPDGHTITIDAPTLDQKRRLEELGYITVTLPDGHIAVYANTDPAVAALQSLIRSYDHYTINLDAQVPGGHLVVGRSAFANAEGAFFAAMANGQAAKLMAGGGFMSPSTAQVVPPNTWRIIGDRPVGDEAFIPINDSQRSADILALTAARMGYGLAKYAGGGFFGPINGTVFANTAHAAAGLQNLIRQIRDQLNSQLASMFSGGAGSPAIRALGQQIANAMGWGGQFGAIDYIFSHESGWNPSAQNPTSTANGIPQFLASTRALYGGNWADPAVQIRDGIQYMVDRYGSPNGAAAFWQAHHWYDDGGVLQPGATLALNGTGKPETVRTAEQETSLQAILRSREMTAAPRVIVVPASQQTAAGRSAPLMQIENAHFGDQADIELALQQAQFRERAGTFSW